ncbi:MAG: transcription elongation factor GreB [Deltaproteobacteria bacterium]|nr:MAG: transcription elongation factor GreB [Deltaproteobacteria bacterium]
MRGRKRYITPEGYRALEAELEDLWKRQRPQVVREVADAAALGDRSENAEYIYGKKKLREIDRRIRHLSKRLDELTVVTPDPAQAGRVFFGAWVTVEDEEGETATYRIVGPDEFDPARRWISVDSPLARALLGKGEGDVVLVRRPKGEAEVEIVAIAYEEPAQ